MATPRLTPPWEIQLRPLINKNGYKSGSLPYISGNAPPLNSSR